MARSFAIFAVVLVAPAAADPTLSENDRPSELGLTLGGELGGRSTAGGMAIAGIWTEHLVGRVWFDSQARFTFGSRRAACGDDMCANGVARGYATELGGAVRIFSVDSKRWMRTGVAGRMTEFRTDDIVGYSLLVRFDIGYRFRGDKNSQYDLSAGLFGGPGWFSGGLRSEPQFGGGIAGTISFDL